MAEAGRISWDDFERVELRVGTIVEIQPFPEAKKPAYKIWVDFGNAIGRKQSSAQITDLYAVEELMGRQVLAVLNFEPKKIAGFTSEVLITGFADDEGKVVLAAPDMRVPNGSKLF